MLHQLFHTLKIPKHTILYTSAPAPQIDSTCDYSFAAAALVDNEPNQAKFQTYQTLEELTIPLLKIDSGENEYYDLFRYLLPQFHTPEESKLRIPAIGSLAQALLIENLSKRKIYGIGHYTNHDDYLRVRLFGANNYVPPLIEPCDNTVHDCNENKFTVFAPTVYIEGMRAPKEQGNDHGG